MNRRSFLKRFAKTSAVAAVAVAVAPKVFLSQPETFTGTFKTLDNIKTTPALDLETLRMLRQSLVARNVLPGHSGRFHGVIHPFVLKDVWVDPIEPGGWVSYKFRYTTSMSPDSRFRIRHKEVQADY